MSDRDKDPRIAAECKDIRIIRSKMIRMFYFFVRKVFDVMF